MTNVYAWPPVGVIGSEWTEDAPVSVSRSLLTGARFLSTGQRKRRLARLDVSALARGQMGAGYVEVLKRLLEGGIHLVRLYSRPINWYLDVAEEQSFRQSSAFLEWAAGGVVLEWVDGAVPLLWFEGTALSGVIGTDGGFPSLTISGLPPGVLVARPGEFVTVYGSALPGSTKTTIMVVAPAHTDAGGVVVIRLLSAAPYAALVSIGTHDTGVFEVVSFPRAVQPLSGGWTYAFEFREVFADEVPGGFVEINPWS